MVRLPWRTRLNFWLDSLLAILFVLLATVTSIAQLIFPVGPGSENWYLWGGDILAWRGLEFGILCALGLGIVVHVMLHWDWVCQIFTQIILGQRLGSDDGRRTIYGVLVLMGGLSGMVVVLILAELMIQPPPGMSKIILPGR
jgi:hypothetical protein